MKRISRNLTAAALASSLTMAGVAAASAEETDNTAGNDKIIPISAPDDLSLIHI